MSNHHSRCWFAFWLRNEMNTEEDDEHTEDFDGPQHYKIKQADQKWEMVKKGKINYLNFLYISIS